MFFKDSNLTNLNLNVLKYAVYHSKMFGLIMQLQTLETEKRHTPIHLIRAKSFFIEGVDRLNNVIYFTYNSVT